MQGYYQLWWNGGLSTDQKFIITAMGLTDTSSLRPAGYPMPRWLLSSRPLGASAIQVMFSIEQ